MVEKYRRYSLDDEDSDNSLDGTQMQQPQVLALSNVTSKQQI